MLNKNKEIIAVDLFAGAGGTSTGLLQAARELGYTVNLTAINHWDVAISTHYANHPSVNHLCANLNNVNPFHVVPNGYLDILVASPECTHHSNARGGKPRDEQSRAGADFVTMWAEKLYIENILIENVREFMSWGPLDKNRQPIKKLKGKLFLNFIERLKALDYIVEYRVLNAANYGDATTRERLFIIARKSHKKIAWPEPTHSKNSGDEIFYKTKDWKPARDIIDWSVKGKSIFNREKPLAENTMNRIFKGLEKFGMQPFIAEYHGQTRRNGHRVKSIDQPLPTQDTSNRFALCQPFILGQQSNSAARSIDQPIHTILGSGYITLVEPYIVKMYGTANAASIDNPLPTVVGGNGHLYLCEPYIVSCNHGKDMNRSYSIDKPIPTITGVHAFGLVQPFLVKYNSTGTAKSLNEPLDTITGKDRFGLVMPISNDQYALVDILFRMLTPKELAAAMSFPENYVFKGPKNVQVKQIGNAVPVKTAKALCRSLLSE